MPQLTSDQKKAVETVGCNVCVSAGAGTGKTSVLVERFLYLISNKLARSNEILAITFTEKAAQEMKSRIAARLKQESLEEARRELENAYIGTIHSFCSRILKEHPIEAGVDPEFRVLQEEEANLLKESALDELIESRFQEPDVFDLLRVYSDNEIREALKDFVEKTQPRHSEAEGRRISEPQILRFAQNDVKRLLDSLKPLKSLSNKESDCAELEEAISKPISNWNELEAVKEIGKRFQRRGKAQEQIELFRKALDEWMAAEAERLGQNYRNTFLNLATDFETRYSMLKSERSSLDFNDLERKAYQLLSGDHPRSVACRNLYQKHFKFIMVDEFQDTSPLQDRLISLVARPGNLFIVGDWKQAIYGFRGSDPSIFIEKEKLFRQAKGEQISLVENFRSRSEVLDEINSFFETHLFSGHEIQFEALKAVSPFPEKAAPSVEFLVVDRKEDESVAEVRMNEARVLAKRIFEMVKSGDYRYQDFAMLFRATTDIYFYEYELRNYGIPYYVVGGRGFYKQPEIRDVVSFLELLENPHLDIPLAAVLRSPFVQISDDSLFWLAEHSSRLEPAKPFYEALLHFETIPEIKAEDKAKLESFRSFLSQLLSEKEKWSISECIELIMEQTKYNCYVLHLSQGKRHFANIRKLLEVAREVETRERVHLGDFIRYVKGLQTQEVRESEAQVEALEGNVVKLMTIHKAKGLEFKVVLLPDLNRKGEKRGGCFLMDSEYGIGLKVFNEYTRKLEEGFTYQKIKEKTIRDACQEAKRLLYVAMTRAKDHLILSGSSKSEEESNFSGFDEGANWFEWIRQWSASSETLKPQLVDIPKEKLGRHVQPLAEHKKIKSALEESRPIHIKVPEGISQMIDFLKPIKPVFFERIDLPVSAYSVFKHDPEEFRKTYELGVLPEELSELGTGPQYKTDLSLKLEEWLESEDEEAATLSAADFGTVIHKIFEHLVAYPEKAPAKLKFWLEHFQKSLNESTFKEVKTLSDLFLKSKQFSEIKSAKKRYPELPFVLRLHHGIIQGTLDLLYQSSAGDWVIVDYKTSVIARTRHEILAGTKQSKTVILSEAKNLDPSALPQDDKQMFARNDDDLRIHADRYQGQMLLYALACHELLNIRPKFATLYFVRVDRSFEFSLADVDFKQLRQEFESLQKQILAGVLLKGTL